MPNYQNGKIYKIIDNETNKCFFGSTIETLIRRLEGHKGLLKKHQKCPNLGYCVSYEILINNNYRIELVELFPCNSKSELVEREQFYIMNNECINIKLNETKTISKQQYIKERNARFNITHSNYRAYDYLQKKLKTELEQLPSELKEKYDKLHYTDKYFLLRNVNSMIRGVGDNNIFSYLQSVLIQHFSKTTTQEP